MMTLPRLAFTDNMFCVMDALKANGIPVDRSYGVFWEQGITRLLQKRAVEGEFKYLLTIDYDSWFTINHVIKLHSLMESHPEYDAIMPVQAKRDDERALYGDVDPGYYEDEVIPVGSGHLGLTLFRADCFKKLPKPWMEAKPDEFGEWGPNRTDPDIAFWKNFKESGCKLGVAQNVKIGHMQLMCSFPGQNKDQWAPIHTYIKDVSEGKIPDWIIPPITTEEVDSLFKVKS